MHMFTNVRDINMQISKALAADSFVFVSKNFCYKKLGVPWTDPAFPPSNASVGAAKVRQLGRKVVEDGG